MDKYANQKKIYREKDIEKWRAHCRDYYYKNKASILESQKRYQRERRKLDPNFKLAQCLRNRLNRSLKKVSKASHVKNLGCSVEELRVYLESKFLPGMTWENHGLKGWHIDHIVPLCKFDLTDPDQLKKACHFSNLQPLWAKDNIRKRSLV